MNKFAVFFIALNWIEIAERVEIIDGETFETAI